MSSYSIPYGRTFLTFDIPDTFRVDVISPNPIQAAKNPQRLVKEAIANPIGGVSLSQYKNASSVAIAINDITRPVPNHHLLPPLLETLAELDIPREAITFIIASGTHVPMRPVDFVRVLPSHMVNDYKILPHNTDDEANLVYIGQSRLNTPIWINRTFYEADLKIVIGDIEPHHFAGFSGGMKTAAIGLAGRKTINQNHRFIIDPNTIIAKYEGNPLREDIEDIGQHIGVNFALNAILNPDREIVNVFFGDPVSVMKQGIPISRKLCQVNVKREYPLVIASPGGFPKDINIIQAQKATTHASLITKPGGKIILVAECIEGSGSQGYEKWMEGVDTIQEIIDKTTQGEFQVGPHKAFQFARILQNKQIEIVSSLSSIFLKKLLLTGVPSLDQAMDDSLSNLPKGSWIAILPKATNTIPIIEPV